LGRAALLGRPGRAASDGKKHPEVYLTQQQLEAEIKLVSSDIWCKIYDILQITKKNFSQSIFL
jgi:hypothetical protein